MQSSDVTTVWQWFTQNTLLIFALLFTFFIIAFNKFPSISTWQAFLKSFESKGGQLMLLWVTDIVVLAVLVHYWQGFSATLQNFMTGLISGINGAFLGAIGARDTGTPAKADTLKVGFTPEAEKDGK